MKTLLIITGSFFFFSFFTLTVLAQATIADTQHQFTYDANGNRIKRELIAINVILRNAGTDSTKEELTGNEEQNFNEEQTNTIAQNGDVVNNQEMESTESSTVPEHSLFLAGHTIKAYPNPVNQQLNLEIAGLQAKPNNIVRIYEMNGRLISESRLSSSQELNFSNYSAGTYLLVIWIDGKKKEVEIVKY